mmetsp:Transcript_17749/g.56786  ORF Transcript_17749/g.56786 Transcript_17749/m.56786 type:complete len:660 (-) Transcript_17749:208-2187(-)
MACAASRLPCTSLQADGVGSELALHPRAVAMQRDVVARWKVDASSLLEGLCVDDHAEAVTGGLVADEAQQDASILPVTVGLRDKHRLPGELTGDVLLLPLPNLVGVVVLLRQPQHAVVVDDAETVPVPGPVDLGVDLGLIEAVLGPPGPRALARGHVHAEAPDLAATPAPVLNVPGLGLAQGKSNRWLVVADDVQVDNIAVPLPRLERVDCVEEKKRVRLEDSRVLAGLPVDEADERRPLRLPRVVIVEVALVLACEQPLALCAQHAVPVEGVRDLDHHYVPLGQRDRVDGGWELRLDPGDQAPLDGHARLARLIGLHGEHDVFGLEAHVLRADPQLDREGEPLAGDGVQVRLGVEDERPALHQLVREGQPPLGLHVAEGELQERRAHRHGHAPGSPADLGDVQVPVLVVGRGEHVEEPVPDVRQRRPGAGLPHRDAPGLAVAAVVPGVEPAVPVGALALPANLEPVQHGLAVHPVHELVVPELELRRPGVHQAPPEPGREGTLHAESGHLELLAGGLEPILEVDAYLVGALGTCVRRDVCHQVHLLRCGPPGRGQRLPAAAPSGGGEALPGDRVAALRQGAAASPSAMPCSPVRHGPAQESQGCGDRHYVCHARDMRSMPGAAAFKRTLGAGRTQTAKGGGVWEVGRRLLPGRAGSKG